MNDHSRMVGINLGLARISSLLHALRSPHLATPIIHIAGTNGKGSVAAYLSSILGRAALRVGRFNSPHLVDEWDCIQIGGQTIDRSAYEEARDAVRQADRTEAIGATSFELLTATAFEIFRRADPKLDVAVIEVGMGGLTDATNVVDADHTLLSLVTSIELDHQSFLGDTVAEIASVKAGIVKTGVEVVVAKQNHPEVYGVLEHVADTEDAPVFSAGEGSISSGSDLVSLPLQPARRYPDYPAQPMRRIAVRLPLPGLYQLANAAAASVAAQVLRSSPRASEMLPPLGNITDGNIKDGIEATRWPGRLDWLSVPHPSRPAKKLRVLVDGAHNPSSAAHLSEYLASLTPSSAPTTLIIGLSSPRAPASILDPLLRAETCRISRVICVPFSAPESMPWIKSTPAHDVATAAGTFESVRVEEAANVEAALALLEDDGVALVAGSLYLVADVYRLLRTAKMAET